MAYDQRRSLSQMATWQAAVFLSSTLSLWATTEAVVCAKINLPMSVHVFLIGHGLFRDGLARLLASEPSVVIVGAADTWAEAENSLLSAQPDTLIVDHAAPELRQDDLAPLLVGAAARRVIYVTLTDNTMVVHERQARTCATVPNLLRVLRKPAAVPAAATKSSRASRPPQQPRVAP